MKIQNHHAKELAQVLGSVNSASRMPIADKAFLSYKDGTLIVEATSLETWVKVSLPCEGEAELTLAPVDKAKLIKSISLTVDEIELAVSPGQITLIDGDFSVEMPISTENYPKPEAIKAKGDLTIDGKELTRIFRATAYAVCKDDSRANLLGINIDLGSDKCAVTTDGRRLAKADASFETNVKEGELLLPPSLCKLIKNSKHDGSIQISFDDEKILVVAGNIEVVSSQITGQFPNYRQVLPQTANLFSLDRQKMLRAVKRVDALKVDTSLATRMLIKDGKAEVSFRSNDNLISDSFEVESSEEFDFKFNAAYLIGAAEALCSEVIELKYNDAASPISLTEDGAIHVIMPMRQD